MIKLKPRNSLIDVIILSMVLLIIVTSTVLGAMWVHSEYKRFRREAAQERQAFFEEQRSVLKGEVDRAVDYIQYMKSQTERVLREMIKERTREAYSIAWGIFSRNRENRPPREIQQMITDALRPVRYNGGRGYYFIVTLSGTEVMYPVFPEFEGRQMLDLQDERGSYVLRDEIDIVRRQGEGFATGYWKKPGAANGEISRKISFVKLFEPYDWYIGTGEYVDDVTGRIKKEVRERVGSIRFGPDHERSVFILDYNGESLVNHPGKTGLSHLEQGGPSGLETVRKEISEARQNPDGVFVEESTFRDAGGENSEELTFVRAVPDWQWVVGASVSTREIQANLEAKRAVLLRGVRDRIFLIGLTIGVLSLGSLLILNRISGQIQANFASFASFFQRASRDFSEIDLATLKYSEFRELAVSANSMLRERIRMEREIRAVNDLLQGRVAERTLQIRQLNESLESRIEERTRELQKLTETDGLTGLCNKRFVLETLRGFVGEAAISGQPLSLIMLDLDHFKKINDAYGHVFGDQVLQEVGETLRQLARDSDVVGRYGGEEFLVLLPGADRECAVRVGHRILEGVRSLRFEEKGLSVTFSAGVAELEREEPPEGLVQRADTYLYQAKANGRDRVEG